MRIVELTAGPDWTLSLTAEDGRRGRFDVRPYLGYEAFLPLREISEFTRLVNGGYFVEWECGADLSADTIEAFWQVDNEGATPQETRMLNRNALATGTDNFTGAHP